MLGIKLKQFFKSLFFKKEPPKLKRAQKRQIWRESWKKFKALDKKN
jgi:hypothetical protein